MKYKGLQGINEVSVRGEMYLQTIFAKKKNYATHQLNYELIIHLWIDQNKVSLRAHAHTQILTHLNHLQVSFSPVELRATPIF